MTVMPIDYASALLDQNALLVETFAGADLSIAVPTCPEWTLLQLMRHIGRGDRWAAQMIRDNVSDLDVRAVVDGRPPDDIALALDWLRASPAVVVDAVANCGEGALVPTFLGPRPGVWWLRRRLHETTVHRADAAIARTSVGDDTPYELAPELAADGIDEWVERLVEFQRQGTMPPSLLPGQRLAFHTTDDSLQSASWLVEGTESGLLRRDTNAEEPDTTMTGTAEDLFLAMVRRRPIEDSTVRIDGDPSVWNAWLEGTPL